MATGGHSSLLEELECPICKTIYYDPRMLLPCQHTYCKSCLEQLVRTSDSCEEISCPECRGIVTVPKGGISGFTKNLSYQKLLQRLMTDTCDCGRTENLTLCQAHCYKTVCDKCKPKHRNEIEFMILDTMRLCATRLEELDKRIADIEDPDVDFPVSSIEDITSMCDSLVREIRNYQQHMTMIIQQRNDVNQEKRAHKYQMSEMKADWKCLFNSVKMDNLGDLDPNDLIILYRQCVKQRAQLESEFPKKPEAPSITFYPAPMHKIEDELKKLDDYRMEVLEKCFQARPISRHMSVDETGKAGKKGRMKINFHLAKPKVQQVAYGVTVTDDGLIWFVDTTNCQLHSFDSNSRDVMTIGPNCSAAGGEMKQPSDVVQIKDGNLAITDTGNSRVVIFSITGTFKYQVGQKGEKIGNFQEPFGISISNDGLIYIVDRALHRVTVFNDKWKSQFSFGQKGCKDGEFTAPTYIKAYSDKVIVSDTGNDRLQLFSKRGDHILTIKDFGKGQINPHGVTIGFNNRIVFCDDHNKCIQVLNRDFSHHSSIGKGEFASLKKGLEILRDGRIVTSEVSLQNTLKLKNTVPDAGEFDV